MSFLRSSLAFLGMTTWTVQPFRWPSRTRPMSVLPLVRSTLIGFGLSLPSRSAPSSMARTARPLTFPPGVEEIGLGVDVFALDMDQRLADRI